MVSFRHRFRHLPGMPPGAWQTVVDDILSKRRRENRRKNYVWRTRHLATGLLLHLHTQLLLSGHFIRAMALVKTQRQRSVGGKLLQPLFRVGMLLLDHQLWLYNSYNKRGWCAQCVQRHGMKQSLSHSITSYGIILVSFYWVNHLRPATLPPSL